MFGYGSLKARANGRVSIKVEYDSELQMSRLIVGDSLVELEVFLPTQKLSQLLLEAYESQTQDPNAIGHDTWLLKAQPVSKPQYHTQPI